MIVYWGSHIALPVWCKLLRLAQIVLGKTFLAAGKFQSHWKNGMALHRGYVHRARHSILSKTLQDHRLASPAQRDSVSPKTQGSFS